MNVWSLKTSTYIRKALRLENTLAAILAFFLYTLVCTLCLSPTPVQITEKNKCPQLLSTETKSPLKQSILHAVDTASESITLLIYNLCDKQLLSRLQKASLRGVRITIIADPYSSADIEKNLSPPVKVYLRKPSRGLMHLKILVIDHHNVWLGSANMSASSLVSHGNLCAAFSSKIFAQYIEAYAQNIIDKKPFTRDPLTLPLKQQQLILYIHPQHAQASLQHLVHAINQATKRVFVAMYTFTNKDLVDSLIKANIRGVDVRAVFDQDSAKNTSKVAYQLLMKNKIPTGTRTIQGLLHHKIALIDDTLAMGSCNWTKAGFFSNADCILWLNPLDKSQKEQIDNLWKEIETNSTLIPIVQNNMSH